jgi:hypothetical protein
MTLLDETAIRILGPLEVQHRDQPVNLGVRRQRLIFGLLVLEAGKPVQIERLITIAWAGQAPPATARNTPAAAEAALARLVGLHLVDEPRPSRYRLHDLLHLYAAEQAASDPADRTRATDQVLTWYLDTAQAASQRLYDFPEPEPSMGTYPADRAQPIAFTADTDAITWLNDERGNLVAAVTLASAEGLHTTAWLIAHSLKSYFSRTRHATDWLQIAEAGLAAAAHTADPRAHAAMRLSLGAVSHCLGRLDDAAGAPPLRSRSTTA